ncbi:S8 family serine peptidase, partial [Candidatus Woesearchaeota archaeon]|nr:S8 family serine peptidase [Candidatus Woesearchaeota archaeon]
MGKRGKIVVSLVIFIVLILTIFILQSREVITQTNEETNQPTQATRGFGGGGSVLSEQTKKPETPENLITNFVDLPSKIFEENFGENLTLLIPTYIDPLIERELNKTIEVPVIVKIKDTSRIKVTSKDSIELQELKDRTKKEILENKTRVVLNSLLPSEFKLKDAFLMGNGFYGNITKEGFHKLRTNPDIYYITLDRYVSVKLIESRVMVNASSVNNAGYNGTHQTACVIDSGIDYTHPALGGCFGATCKVRGGWNYDNNSGIPMDNANHGTIVAGIIASEHKDVRGIAPAARLVALRVCDDTGQFCPVSSTEQALQFCYNNRNIFNISVVSMSLGDGEYTSSNCPTDAATEIGDLHAVGIPVIAVSGNEAFTNGINWPACRANTTSVGAVYDGNFGFQIYNVCTDLTTGSDIITCFTNRKVGLLDLLAPGCRINSTNQGALNFSYECGTSFAGPMVVGAVALLKQLNKSLTADEIENTFKNTGVTIGDYKRINILAALNAIRDKDNDNYYDQAYGGNDCNDNNAAVNPGATEVCDGIDNDCDSIVDEGCSQDCTQSGYEQCFKTSFGDCNASIAVNYYTNVNNIQWGAVNDSSDPYVINQYQVGWKGVIAKKVYYNVSNPNNNCNISIGGCNNGVLLSNTGIRVTVNAPNTASTAGILSYNETQLYWCWIQANGFNPNYGQSNPIFVLKCFADSDCSSGSYCNKTGTWNQWACVTKYANGVQCTQDSQCQSNYCDNDGIGLSDDGWCFTPYNTYFDGQENTYCEYSTDNGIADCDERQVNGSITSCTLSGQAYFGDRCTSSCGSEDSNICRSSAFASGCTADTECDGIVAGTENCNSTCKYNPPPSFIRILFPVNNAQYTSSTLDLNWTANNTLASCYYKLDESNYNNIICRANYSYSGFSFSVATQDTSPEDVTIKGNNFYVLGRFNEAVYEYDSAGTYTGTSFSVASQDVTPQGLTWNGSRFYMTGSATDKIYEYDSSGVYTGFSFSVSSQDTDPTAITHKDGYFYVLGASTQRVYKYNSAGTYASFNFSVSSQDSVPEGLVWDGISFYIVGGITDRVYEYFPTGSYTGFNFSISGQDTNGKGITTNGSSFFIVGATGDKVYKYISNNAALSNTTLNDLSVGKHNVTIYGKGSDGNTAQTNYTYFNITTVQPDTTPPIVNTTLNVTLPRINDVVNISANITDETGLSTANITINFTTGTVKINFTLSGT